MGQIGHWFSLQVPDPHHGVISGFPVICQQKVPCRRDTALEIERIDDIRIFYLVVRASENVGEVKTEGVKFNAAFQVADFAVKAQQFRIILRKNKIGIIILG